MGTGMKLLNVVIREAARAQKAAAREAAKHEREQIRRQNQYERNRIREEKEAERTRIQLKKEGLKADKEKIKHDLVNEQKEYEKRISERRAIRLNLLNRMKKGA
jgi:hypothetical protein